MVFNFHCNKWITGGDPTKQQRQPRAALTQRPEPAALIDKASLYSSISGDDGGDPLVQGAEPAPPELGAAEAEEDRSSPVSEWCNESAGHGQMMDVETSYSDFINCDRTGRRNAVPDISGEETAVASTSELTKDMAEMDLKAAEGDPGASPAPETEGSTGQDGQGGGGPS